MSTANESIEELKDKIVQYIGQKYNKSDEQALQAYNCFEKQIMEDINIIKKQTGMSIVESYDLYEINNYHIDNSMIYFYDPEYVKNKEKECMDEYNSLPEVQKKIKHFNYIMAEKDKCYEVVQSQQES